uniref:Cytoplasmic dynein 2 heavy chain 1 n=2 Tax=Cacopsylla melanoneura TaxID=428564 RepID=A0A8D8QIW2_9HEMI
MDSIDIIKPEMEDRETFLLKTSEIYFGTDTSSELKVQFCKDSHVSSFLDDPNCMSLCIQQGDGGTFDLQNKIPNGNGHKVALIFYKTKPECISSDNVRQIVLISSLKDSPISSLYYSLHQIFSPALLKGDDLDRTIDPKLQSLVLQLEHGLKSTLLEKSLDSDLPTSLIEVLTLEDEYFYWKKLAQVGTKKKERDRGEVFANFFEPMVTLSRSSKTKPLQDLDDVLETMYNFLDDLWKMEDYEYPQDRMSHLMELLGNNLVRLIQQELNKMNLWQDEFNEVVEKLKLSTGLCEKWLETCSKLTTYFWPNYPGHMWSGPPAHLQYVQDFTVRLKQIVQVRVVHRQISRLLSANEQEEFKTKSSFDTFYGINALLYNAYTESIWSSAIKAFENHMRPSEERVGGKLKMQFKNVNTNTLQLLQEYRRYIELIQRPVIKSILQAERQMLLSQLQEYLLNVSGNLEDSSVSNVLDMPPLIANIQRVKHLETKIIDIEKVSEELLNDLPDYDRFKLTVNSVKKEVHLYHTEQYNKWLDETSQDVTRKVLSLKMNESVVYFEEGKLMHVNYNPNLVKLVNEVRNLKILGYKIPEDIENAAHQAKQFKSQAKALEQVANFHNTIGDRMIVSQRPMMLVTALELAKLVQGQHGITWTNTGAVDAYIGRLQTVVEKLANQNNKLAWYHSRMIDKVAITMDTDLLRHQHKWKEQIKDMREIVKEVEGQFTNTKLWKNHWDHQLFKALDYQYQLGLEALNQHLPEMKVELVYRQQKLQYSPPMEEIRMKYYGQLKTFLSIPQNFRGLDDDTKIFPQIIERNASKFAVVFKRAEDLFNKLIEIKHQWEDRVALGSVDFEHIIRENLNVASDWDLNFRASKTWGQEIAKLSCSEEKVECFLISFAPVRSEIELHNRRYWDSLAASLYYSIMRDVTILQNYIVQSKKSLERQPQTLDDIGEINAVHRKILETSKQMMDVIIEAENKNRTLASWTKEHVDQLATMKTAWDNFHSLLDNQQFVISHQVETMKNNLITQTENIQKEIEKFKLKWDQMKPKEDILLDERHDDDSDGMLMASVRVIEEKRTEWNKLLEEIDKNKTNHEKFSLKVPDYSTCDEIQTDLKNYEDNWSLFGDFIASLEDLGREEWIVIRGRSVQKLEDFLAEWKTKLSERQTSPLTVKLNQEIEKYRNIIPCLKYVRGETFSDKHWLEFYSIVETPYKPIELILFKDILSVKSKILDHITEIQDLNTRASSEIVIRQALTELDVWEVEARFELVEHIDSRDNKIKLLKDFKSIMNKVGDNQCLLQSIKSSPNYSEFLDRATLWEKKLYNVDHNLRNLNQVQRKWVYLEPIFGNGKLEIEKSRFAKVDKDLRYILNQICASEKRVITLHRIQNINSMLETMVQQLTQCQKSLNDYLEKKRSTFPRFYFLSDEDLLEILGQSNKPNVIQSHLKKLFAGIHSVIFNDENNIVSMKSLEGEIVNFSSPILITSDIEEWLHKLSIAMKQTIKEFIKQCVIQPDPVKYPSQVLCISERITFTKKCEEAIEKQSLEKFLSSLKNQLDKTVNVVMEDESDGAKILNIKRKHMILELIYHVRLVEALIDKHVTNIHQYHWRKYLRYYMENGEVVIKMVDAKFTYSYEYQGSGPKLVHTPLTDKCYLTLTQAMHMGLGGNPYGPAGTGKTESVKALGSLLARQVLVFNCDEGIDVQSLTRILVGLAKCGAWGCFDEFNRLDEATLSAISTQIHAIQEGLKNHSKSIKLLDQEVELDGDTGIFVTLNPAGKGYGGRQKLPDNLKQLFRPVVMSKPDNELITETILLCEGFRHAKVIGRKLVQIFDLAKKLLSPQQHYDWGLRALKTVVAGCGSALKSAKQNEKSDSVDEMSLVVQVLRLNTLSKLTFSDSTQFDLLIQDIFQDITFLTSGYETFVQNIRKSYEELGLIYSARQERKCLELYEQLLQRMGVVIVGPSGSGKTTICKILKQTLLKTGRQVQQHTINPKAMPRTQLLGQIDLDTRQWTDGVLSYTAQQVYSEPLGTESWILCDGDVDPEWIESLNSVLDDNRLLTLPSGWRIQFGPGVNFLFETHDLQHASPATISRMGIILLSEEDIDINGLLKSWINKQPEDKRVTLQAYIESYFIKGFAWVKEKGELAAKVSPTGIIQNGLSHMTGVQSKAHVCVALIKGLGSNLTIESRNAFAIQVLEWTGEFVADVSKVDLCYYNEDRDSVDIHVNEHGAEQRPLILTAQVKAAVDAIMPWIQDSIPFIMQGPHGSGKSLILEHCLSQLHGVVLATIHCSASISPQHLLHKLSHLCMTVSSTRGRVYVPNNCERVVLYFKDLNLARNDKWGSNMLVAFLQQIITYGGFYEDSSLEWVGIERVHIISSVTRSDLLSTRFTSINCILNIGSPSRDDLMLIYGTNLGNLIRDNKMASSISSIMINLYNELSNTFTIKNHSHYRLSPRDLSNFCRGLKRYGNISNPKAAIRAILYESDRIFKDKLASQEDRHKYDSIIENIVENEWMSPIRLSELSNMFYVCESMGRIDSVLVEVELKDWSLIVQAAYKQLVNEGQCSPHIVFIPELLSTVSYCERILSETSAGSLVFVGSAGFGRKLAVKIVAIRLGAKIMSPKMSVGYNVNSFKADLKGVLQVAALDNQQVFLLLEDYHLFDVEVIDLINSLLSSAEIPGLYQAEEFEAVCSTLKDASSAGKSSTQCFMERLKTNLHLVLIFDSLLPNLSELFNNNPALLKNCSVIWANEWSTSSMELVSRTFIMNSDIMKSVSTDYNESLIKIHQHASLMYPMNQSPMRFTNFVNTNVSIFTNKHKMITDRQNRLQAGITKLTEAKQVVDTLKKEADEQESKLAEKQSKATSALEMITQTMKHANTQKDHMANLKQEFERENLALTARKKEIDAELAEVEPLIEEARSAVGNIKSESLSEIRSLRAPPDIIRDILEGVLRLMGIQDTSWNSMKTFLAKRGVKEEIRYFDARSIRSESRQSVEQLLHARKDSFDPAKAKRASAAALPLAIWVTANVKYSRIMEKIMPLEKEQQKLKDKLKIAEDQIGELSEGLNDVDKTVSKLKDQLNSNTKEAAEIELKLVSVKDTIAAAEGLISKLDEEFSRWGLQLEEFSSKILQLPTESILAAAFVVYLSNLTEDKRDETLNLWQKHLDVKSFSVSKLLNTEQDQLLWISQGLSSDRSSIENGVIVSRILESEPEICFYPLLIDPSSIALNWLLKLLSNKSVEVVSQLSSKFYTTLELSIRFGKILIIQEVGDIHPVLIPILRREFTWQGARKMIQVGNKSIDFNDGFRLFLVTRNPTPNIEPNIASLLTFVNYATTHAGLSQQLLDSALQIEKPELQLKRRDLLRREEEMKSKLFDLQENVLKQLANAEGNILENKALLKSLNETKSSSEEISQALTQSKKLQSDLQVELEMYLPLGQFAASSYFAVQSLSRLNPLYQLSIPAFIRLFQANLESSVEEQLNRKDHISVKGKRFLHRVYHYVCRSLLKSDRFMFALHLIHHMYPNQFQDNEWELLTGSVVGSDTKPTDPLPNWINADRSFNVLLLQSALPPLYAKLNLASEKDWTSFMKYDAPLPEHVSQLTPFQKVLVAHCLKPEQVYSALTQFALDTLELTGLSPPALRLNQVLSETFPTEPILLITTPGSDPSTELRQLAENKNIGKLKEIALGEGDLNQILDDLDSLSKQPCWVILKNLHLMTNWLPQLEKFVQNLTPDKSFRLWMTTECHSKFSATLASACLKLSYEAPQGIKRNLQRTYASWSANKLNSGDHGRALFTLAWFHALVQERRTYIPQGWAKFYEFNDSDLNAALNILNTRLSQDGISGIKWDYIHGLLGNAVYGGRIDNAQDMKVMTCYLEFYFSDQVARNASTPLAPGVALPSSTNMGDYINLIQRLSEIDPPKFFGLPENVNRSWQLSRSVEIIEQLKTVHQEPNVKQSD